MARSISPTMARVLEELELNQPVLVTTDDLQYILDAKGVKTPARTVATRLRQQGWFLSTARRGVWEFAPAAMAGPYSRHDPETPLRAFLLDHPDAKVALTFQSAAWAHQLHDRAPAHLEIAATSHDTARRLPKDVEPFVFRPRLPYERARNVPVLAVESVIVHMTSRPADMDYWMSAIEWLTELAAKSTRERLEEELGRRAVSIRARTGYLLSGMRPDLAEHIRQTTTLRGKTWFGTRGPLLRHDNRWEIADTLLPFDPRHLASVA